MKPRMKWLVPLAIVFVGALGVVVIASLRPEAKTIRSEILAPLVRVQRVTFESVEFKVTAHGTVAPRTESDLVSQVSGPVVWVSPALASGGFFELGEPLIRVDPADYDVALESARAAVARTESEHQRATKELDRQKLLAKKSVASASRYDDAENSERIAAAALREARAARKRAERDLERTEIRAPYAGRVRQENVGVGQFVTRGAAIGRIYAVDYAEVRLPVPDADLGFLDLPMLYRGDSPEGDGPPVRLRARFAGGEYSWTGRIVRTEGEIDARSRMVNVVARVEDPYGRESDSATGSAVGGAAHARPPLAVGLFVEAEITGRTVENAVVLPRAALRSGDRVLVVSAERRLHFRPVTVLRRERETAVIGDGLAAGDAVVVSPFAAVVDGMAVRIEGEPAETVGGDGGDTGAAPPVSAERS